MHHRRRMLLCLLSAAGLCAWPAQAQRVDYAKADSIRTFDPMLVGGRVYPVWLSDSIRFYYQAIGNAPDRGTIYLVDPRAGTKRVVTDTTTLVDRRSEGPPWAMRSPDKRWDAFVWNHNVYVRPARLSDAEFGSWRAPRPSLDRMGCDAPSPPGAIVRRDSVSLPSGAIALTRDGGGLSGYGFFRFGLEVAQVEAERFRLAPGGLRWSPDSKKLLVERDDLTGVHVYPMYSSTSNHPIDHRYFYAAPGDSAFPRFEFYVLDVARRSPVRVPLGLLGSIGGIGDAKWGRTSQELYTSSADRGYKHSTLSRVNTTTGIPQTIARDSQPTHVELEEDGWAVAEGGDDIFMISERDGWGHLYRYGRDGTLKNQVERGTYRVAAIKGVDDTSKRIYFTALGRESGTGLPYHARLYRVNFDGSGLTLLTPEPGNHTIRRVPGS
ncbi:MAG: DPP IV N-terminal domain-containing protein, partial [Gemmatimonadaceae bacterium]